MELRDELAIGALIALNNTVPALEIKNSAGVPLNYYSEEYQREAHKMRAKYAYDQADAMLNARGDR